MQQLSMVRIFSLICTPYNGDAKERYQHRLNELVYSSRLCNLHGAALTAGGHIAICDACQLAGQKLHSRAVERSLPLTPQVLRKCLLK